MVTFPYPYMNGTIHLGHAFTVTKADFFAAYQQLKGKNSLFPFAFHCTGMPIQSAANRLKRELEEENEEDVVAQPNEVQKQETSEVDYGKFTSKKKKLVDKTGHGTQYSIMEKLGIPESEIPNFKAKFLLYLGSSTLVTLLPSNRSTRLKDIRITCRLEEILYNNIC